MKRFVATHHSMVWQRSHRATSRCAPDSVLQRRSGRRRKLGSGAPQTLLTVPLPQPQPGREAVGQHHRDLVLAQTGPQPPLVLTPPQLPFSLFIELFDATRPMGIARRVFQYGRSRQTAPGVFPFFALPTGGVFPQRRADVPLADAGRPPTAHDRKLHHIPFAPSPSSPESWSWPLSPHRQQRSGAAPSGFGPVGSWPTTPAVRATRSDWHGHLSVDISASQNHQFLGLIRMIMTSHLEMTGRPSKALCDPSLKRLERSRRCVRPCCRPSILCVLLGI
jgi:hypothetical protein